MANKAKRRVNAAPTPKQLAARRKFARMSKALARERRKAKAEEARILSGKNPGRRGVLLTDGRRSKKGKRRNCACNPPKGYKCSCTSPTGAPAKARKAAKPAGSVKTIAGGPKNVRKARAAHSRRLKAMESPAPRYGGFEAASKGGSRDFWPGGQYGPKTQLGRSIGNAGRPQYVIRKLHLEGRLKGRESELVTTVRLQPGKVYADGGGRFRVVSAKKKNPGRRRFTAKQDRQARHIAASERKAGFGKKAARGIGYATVQARRRNSAAAEEVKELNAEFLGRQGRKKYESWTARSTPAHTGELGRLLAFDTTKEQLVFDPRDGYYLVADKNRRLHIVQRSRTPERFEPNSDLGELLKVDYLAVKRHLDNKPTDYYHKFQPTRPRLKTDKEGMLYIAGGSYGIGELGIDG